MNVSKKEAVAALDDIQVMIERTRRAILAAHVADHLIIWGVAWMLGFGAGQFTDWNPGLVWFPVCLAGTGLSAWTGLRTSRTVESPFTGRIFLFFLVLAGFAFVWAFILHPFNQRHFGAYMASVFMFAYVAGGLWFGRFFVVLGLGVTALTVAGVRLAPDWLNLIMAAAGGGSLVAAGLYIRYAWQPRE